MSRLGPDTPHLQAQIHANRMSFLAAELEVANTMLNTAAGSADAESNARRRARAVEARDELERQLAKGAELGLTPAEYETVAAGLARLRARLAER